MKKILTAGTAVILSAITSAAAFAAKIPDHRGTSLDNFSIGTSKVSAKVSQYNDIFKQAGDQFGIDPNILAAVCMQESGGVNYQYRSDGSSYPAWGIMQIEYTNNGSFAEFGEDQTGCVWSPEDRLDPSKAVPYAAYLLSEALYKYDCDYAKMLQSYNFGSIVLDRIIAAAGENWLNERANAVSYVSNWPYSTYGDKEYVEHVLRYYCNNIDYIGSKVRLNGSLVRFDNQYPIIDNGTTMIPVRAISEMLGADVGWDPAEQHVYISSGNKLIDLYVGADTGYINDEPYEIECSAEMMNNRVLVPLRFVAEALEVSVEWNGETRTVELYK
ncbi:MAG: stalk domain-containing protein [Candidatus Ornithomonoglobus sp.]